MLKKGHTYLNKPAEKIVSSCFLYQFFSFLWNIHHSLLSANTAQKMKFSITDFFSTYDEIHIRIWSYLLKKFFLENFIFCAVKSYYIYEKQ